MPRQFVDIIDNVQASTLNFFWKAPATGLHDLERKINRWAGATGYGGATVSGELRGGSYRLICFMKETVETISPLISDIVEFHPLDFNTACHRWANSEGFVTGWHNGERNGDLRGVVCLKDIQFESRSVFEIIDAAHDDLSASPDPRYGDKILRWSQDRDYAAGIPTHEIGAGVSGVVCIPQVI